MTRRLCLVTVCVLVASIALGPAVAQSSGPADNVLLTVRIGSLAGGEQTVEKSYVLVLSPGSEGSQLLAGDRVPIATQTYEKDVAAAEGEEVVAAFTYQNIGFSVTAEAQVIPPDRVVLRAILEDSRIAESDAAGPPTVETRQLSVNVILKDGEPLVITRVERAEGAGYVEVQADLVK